MISERKQKIYIVLVCAIAIIIMIFLGIRNRLILGEERNLHARYTIATTLKSHIGLKQSSPSVYYKYQVKNIKYEKFNTYNPDWNIKTTGGNYLVRYSSKDPENAEILLDLGEVPDSIAYPLYFNSCDTLPKW